MKTDKIFYTLFQTFPQLLFELTEQDPNLAQVYEFTSVEIKELAFRIDGLFFPKINSLEYPIYFVEVQFQKDEDFYWRFLTEIFIYLGQYKVNQTWQAVVIWARRSLDEGVPLPYQDFLTTQQLQQIYLDELTLETTESLGLEIIQFIVSSEEKAKKQIQQLLEQAQRQLTQEIIKKQVIELIERIVIYKFPQKSRQELEKMFDLTSWKQTRFYQDVKEEGKLETVPLLLRLGLTVEQIAQELELNVETVRQVAENPSNGDAK